MITKFFLVTANFIRFAEQFSVRKIFCWRLKYLFFMLHHLKNSFYKGVSDFHEIISFYDYFFSNISSSSSFSSSFFFFFPQFIYLSIYLLLLFFNFFVLFIILRLRKLNKIEIEKFFDFHALLSQYPKSDFHRFLN